MKQLTRVGRLDFSLPSIKLPDFSKIVTLASEAFHAKRNKCVPIFTVCARMHRFQQIGVSLTWMRQPSWQGIALFSVRMEFWRSTGHGHDGLQNQPERPGGHA